MKNKKNRYYDLCCVLPSDDDLEESKVLFAYSTSNIKSLILSAIMDSYSAIAYNVSVKGQLTLQNTCKLQKLDIVKEMKESFPESLFLSDSPHDFKYFKQFTRISLALSNAKQIHTLSDCNNKVLNSYDIVGVNPVNEKEFKQCCSKLECDIIWLNLFEKLPFFLKRPPIKEAIERGIHFEIRYSDSLRDSTKRKYLIQNAMSLVKYTKGKNIIISSGTYDPIFQRSPNDLIHIASLFGLSKEQSLAAISTNCENVLKHAQNRRVVKGVVAICTQDNLVKEIEEKWEDNPQIKQKCLDLITQ